MTTQQTAKSKYLPHVDGLRTIAVLGVLWAHFHVPGLPGGFLGVDVFFVISGFLITRLILNEKAKTGRFSYGRFYMRRVRRLMPAALATVFFSLLIMYPVLGSKDLVSFLRSIPFAILPVANINFFLEVGYFDASAAFKPLLHFWSLAVEEQYYFIWPTVLLVLLRFPKALLPISIVLCLGSLLAAQFGYDYNLSAAYYLLPFRAFELFVGAILAMIPISATVSNSKLSKSGALGGVGMVAILVSYLIFDETSHLPGVLSLVVCLGTAFVIAFGATGPVGWLLKSRPVVWIGLISYSLYLVHWPIFVYVSYRLPDEPSLAMRLALFPISILVATASYYLIEKRFRHPAPADKRWGNLPFFIGTALVALALVGPTIQYRISPESRIPQNIAFGPRSETGVKLSSAAYANMTGDRRVESIASGQADAPKVLVIGDSHAGHLRYGLINHLAPQGIDVDLSTLTGCQPLFGLTIYRKVTEKPDALCIAYDEARKELVASGGYDTVILAARWNTPVGEREIEGRSLDYIDLVEVDSVDAVPSLALSRDLFQSSFKTTLDQILDTGAKVVILGQVPSPGRNLAQCQSLFPWAATPASVTARCAALNADQIAKRSEFADTVIEDAALDPNVTYVNSRDLYCKDGVCAMNDPDTGEFLYLDSNHLSDAGSVFQFKEADKAFGLVDLIKSSVRSE